MPVDDSNVVDGVAYEDEALIMEIYDHLDFEVCEPLKQTANNTNTDLYAVKLIIKFNRTGKLENCNKAFTDDDFYEESIRIVKATSFDEASQKAQRIAESLLNSYISIYGQTVTEEFYDTIEVYKLYDLADGEEVFSSVFKVPNGADIEDVLDVRYSACMEEEMRVLRNREFNKWNF